MINLPPAKRKGQKVTWEDFNALRAAILRSRISFRGPGTYCSVGPNGTTLSIRDLSIAYKVYIAEVDSNAEGGGYYNCYLQTIDADNWNTDTDALESEGDSVVVMNIAEIGLDVHELRDGDRILCWKKTDDEGNERYIGIPCLKMGTSANAVSDTGASFGGRFIYRWFGEW